MVPKEWKIKTIGDIATVSSGGTPSRKEQSYWNGDIPWVTTAEVKFKTILDSAEKITKEGLSNSSAKLFPINTILMAMYGQGKTRGQVAKLGIEASTNQACAAIILSSDYCVDYYYQFLIYQYENIRDMSNSGSQENLSGSIVKSIPVPVPPYFEQQKIAKILSTWDQAISATEKLLENSQQQKKALMQQLLTGKKRLLDENGMSFSEEWQTQSLDSLFFFKKGKGLSKDMVSEFGQNKCILYGELYTKYPEVIDEIVSRTNSSEGALSLIGDILIPSSTTTSGIDLANAVALLEENVLLGGDINILRPKGEISSEFMAYLLTHIKKYEIASRAQGITIIHLYGSDLKDIEVQIPKKVEEQKKIAKLLSIADQEINTLQKKLVCLNKEKKALMQQLLTGKKRVKVAA
ncbi:restriction endonuclease subunit S [Acinetobacter baumannii]|uniref:restriction endonuclease subunit S n=1 Tax=Acinetobacter baumannii TaxID=470 RepID=UPI00040A3FC7|nr:restriction endonuclease subunit S [Acinetobacter baumannii]EHT1071847.1 restriction endonuclease subunit S [Acinetobacter baumannii]MDI7698217.1 restriction endonuclease subunit S [Acinetobacter baumannii]MDN8165035.1 restriction endonuclease subunit S [Acinetobacter baumannii]MDN8545545.1 restriction endonuclease subunit S [Acinetobacter baumannii]TGO94485.1 restriction endonuclease subunit S [Acinetobacter baumannii]